ncbi:MAG: trypsin-like peptidase domain-containing protein [bacterium]|nr:trypsin-like peptidase domain-containing protein [bacterium]
MHNLASMLGYLLVAALSCMNALADTGQELARQTLPHVITIRMFNAQAQETGLGSGFWLGGGEVVTNAHVVAGGAWAEIHSLEGQLIGTAPYAILLDSPNDLVVLAVPNGRMGGLGLADGDPSVGTAVWAFGAPLGLDGTVSSGIISATRDIDGRRLLQMTVPISSGSSGGPVVDAVGNVVGVAGWHDARRSESQFCDSR